MWQVMLALWLFTTPHLVHAAVVLNELSPRTDPEWIELYNSGSDPVDLTNWYFLDLANNKRIIASPSAFPSNSYYQFSTNSGWLNNTGPESLTLYMADGTALDSLTFDMTDPDTTVARVPSVTGTWYLNQSPTPGQVNATPTPSPSPSPSPSPLPSPSSAQAQTPTPSPTPSPSPSLSPSLSPSPKPSLLPSPSLATPPPGTIAGESTVIDLSAFGVSPSPTSTFSPASLPAINPARAKTALLVGAGLLLVSLAGYFGLRHFRQKSDPEV